MLLGVPRQPDRSGWCVWDGYWVSKRSVGGLLSGGADVRRTRVDPGGYFEEVLVLSLFAHTLVQLSLLLEMGFRGVRWALLRFRHLAGSTPKVLHSRPIPRIADLGAC